MYESMLKPLVGQTGVRDTLKNFWLIFAALDVVAIIGLLLYNRFFSADTPETRRAARRIMIGVYSLLAAAGAWFFYTAGFAAATVNYRTFVQAIIMLLIGLGGVFISLRHRAD
jgi:hypothetical protein